MTALKSCVDFFTRQLAPGDRERNAPGFVPKGEVRQPGADASPHGVTRQRIQPQAARPSSMAVVVFHNGPQRKTPAPKGARVYRRMGEGLGAGGHSTRRYCLNAEASIRFLRLKLFSNLAPPGEAPSARARPVRLVDRQFDMAAIRKLQISQSDAKTALPAAAALDHVARADREPAGETVCKGTHEYPPESKKNRAWELSSSNVRRPRRFRDSLATGR